MKRTFNNRFEGKSLHRTFMGLAWLVGIVMLLMSCKPTVPSKYLSKSEMADILYDIHIAEAMTSVNNDAKDTAAMVTYREAVLKKHDVSLADFDSSMVYYMRHTKLMHDVYEELSDRLSDEAQSLGADVNDANRYGSLAVGDTANVWNGPSGMAFSPQVPFNYYSFDIPVDTAFHKGDKLILDFESQFIYQDGMRDGIAYLAVTFKNDSVATTNIHISSSQHYNMQLEDRDSLGIKSVKGYFLLNKGDFSSDNSSLTTLRLMFIHHIRLVRMHAAKPVAKPNDQKKDSTDQAADARSNSSMPPPRPRMAGPDKAMMPEQENLEVKRP